jgi:hypothetical protein
MKSVPGAVVTSPWRAVDYLSDKVFRSSDRLGQRHTAREARSDSG